MRRRTEDEKPTQFWARVQKSNGCWEWLVSIRPNGYGHFTWHRRVFYAHRVAYELQIGPIPDGKQVCHRCDNRRCVRGDHLFIGSLADNMADMRAKGRQARGDTHGLAKLDSAKVNAIRVAYAAGGIKQSELGQLYRVSRATVGVIVRGDTWNPDGAPKRTFYDRKGNAFRR